MKVRAVLYDDDEQIDTITVSMSLNEAAAIHAIAGRLNGHGQRRLGLGDDDDLYGAICNVFNGHWDDGRPPDAPRLSDELAALNEPPA